MRSPYKSDLIDLEVRLIHETALAWLLDDGKNQTWVPKSMCEFDRDAGVLTLPEATALEKGLI